MQSLYLLRNKKESEIRRILIEESEAEHQAVLLTIRILDQITRKQWSKHKANSSIPLGFVDTGLRIARNA